MRNVKKNQLWILKKLNNGFAIPQVLILGAGISVVVTGLIVSSILGLTGARINRQELIAKASSYSGITTIRSLLNDTSQGSFFHYLWLISSCAENPNECNDLNSPVPNPTQEYWSDDEWCKGSTDCNGRQKAPVCNTNENIFWEDKLNTFGNLFDNQTDISGEEEENTTKDFDQAFNFISTKYIGTERYGVTSMLVEGIATSNISQKQTASNKLRVNIQVISETPEEGFGFLSVGENQLDGKDSLFLGNLNVTPTNDSKGSIIWRRNIDINSDCGSFLEEAKGERSSLPESGNGGIWIQPLSLPKQPRLSNVSDIGILICSPEIIQTKGTNCKLTSNGVAEKTYRIHSLYAKGPGSRFEISTTDDSKIILEIMGDIDISHGGVFCHKDGLNSCGTGKAENLTILFKQKTSIEANKIVCNDVDDFTGGVKLKNKLSFINHQYPLNNNQLPGSSFLIDNTGIDSNEEFGAFVYGPKTTFISVLPESEWVQIPNTEVINNNAGLIITTRSSYGWIKNILGGSFEDKMVNIILSPNGNLIPYLGQKEYLVNNDIEFLDIEIIGVGNKINPLPAGSSLDSSAENILLVYDKDSESYYLRTFEITETNPKNQQSSEYSYPIAFAKMHSKNIKTDIELGNDLDSPNAKMWLDIFNIKIQKSSPNLVRNFAGASWVKNFCLDGTGEKNWNFSKDFIEKLSSRHGEEFNWGVRYYKGRSIILWDTLRDFKS